MSARLADTIAAVATPPGFGGVGVIRISGPSSASIAAAMFRSARAGFEGFKPYRLHHGTLVGPGGAHIDEVLLAFMPGPGSYTGEDVVEISCHGSPAVLAAALAAVVALGARLAWPGEFTKRAFLAGKMDLTQAQAVAELIASTGPKAAALAMARLEGLMGKRVRALRAELEALRAQVCLAVDFPDEEVECLEPDAFLAAVNRAAQAVNTLVQAHSRAKPFREGALAVLAGPVNAGKSSLLNALLGRERAIVSHLPGTTRDFLEESLNLDGLPVRLADTAGLRHATDPIEREGVARCQRLMDEADLVLVVADGSAGLERPLETETGPLTLDPARMLGVVNKADLPPGRPDPAQALAAAGLQVVRVSARTGHGLDELAHAMRARLLAADSAPPDDQPAPNARELDLLTKALAELSALAQDADAGLPPDLLGVRLESACAHLADITGEITPAAVLDSIFDSFCIGK